MKTKTFLITFLFLFSLVQFGIAQEIEMTKDTTKTNLDSGEVFVFVEVNPVYPGGDEARLAYLRDNISYPQEAKEQGIQGTVYVTFVVEKDGRITNIVIARGIGGGCDEEAYRVVANMPKWIPGRQRGVPIRVQYSMPIKFSLTGYEPYKKPIKELTKKELKAQEKQKKKEEKARTKMEKKANKAAVNL